MTPLEWGIAGFVALTLLIYAGAHISTALLTVAFVGTALIRGDWDIAGTMLGQAATDSVTEYEFGTVPLFVLMGFLVMVAGVGRDAYMVAHRLLRGVPGGLGHATVVGNAIFSAITGITVAAVVLFTRLAVPEMLKRGYHPRFAVGIVAGSAMLGMLIPPSVLMIVYAVITETSVGDIYNAGIVPGLLLAGAFMTAIWVVTRVRPGWVGTGSQAVATANAEDDGQSLVLQMLPILALIALVLGGMYGGLFTATEAGAVGAAGALVVALLRRSLDWPTFWSVLVDTGYVTASLILIIAAAAMFSRFLAISGLPSALSNWVTEHQFTLLTVMLVYIAVVLFLGTALDSTSTVLIAVPLFAPIFKALGGDLVWVGIITMIAVEVGLITPPLGISPFVVKASLEKQGLGAQLSLGDIYLGALPFAAAALVVIALIVAFPKIALVLV
ncbi:MAG: TRAP transporter large permease [Burkholderiales bacterium]